MISLLILLFYFSSSVLSEGASSIVAFLKGKPKQTNNLNAVALSLADVTNVKFNPLIAFTLS